MEKDTKPPAELAARFVESLVMLLYGLGNPSDEEKEALGEILQPLTDGDQHACKMTDPVLFFRISHILSRGRTPTMSQLSSELMIPHATATRLAERLVRQGLAERLADPDDRRIVRVALTDRGREFHEVMKRFAVRRVKKVLGSLSREEQEKFVELLDMLAANAGRG